VPTIANGLGDLRALGGVELGPSDWLEITQERVDTFADATGDYQWIHVDLERAANGPFGGPIAHGYLTLALIIPLWTELLRIEGIGMAVNYGLNRVRFPAPVPVGSRVRLHARVVSVEPVRDGVQLTVDFTVEVSGSDKPAVVAQAVYRYHADPSPMSRGPEAGPVSGG
jgi:acyl dehydratase